MAWIPAGIGLLFIGFGLMLIAFGRSADRRTAGAASWQPTDGTITVSEVIESSARDQDTGQWEVRRYASIAYEYNVDGRRHEGHNVDPGGLFTLGAQTVDKYPLGSTVTVYHDPKDPTRAALTRKVSAAGTVLNVIGIALALVALPFLYLTFRLGRRPRPDAEVLRSPRPTPGTTV